MQLPMKWSVLVLLCAQVYMCHAVPPQRDQRDRIWEELDNVKTVMTNIAAQLEKFNALYLMKIEQKVITVASTLANIDSNIKNLQERAHVWDTFQLHVSAWNEQISTLDKRVEIISKGQEKLLNTDGKMSSLSNIDYKLDRIVSKQDDLTILLQTISKLVENQQHDPLFGEFTARGVLGTLKLIERKLDKLQAQHTSSQTLISRQLNDKKRVESEEQKGKLLIKCNTPPKVEEILNDVSSKVDLMFDKFTKSEEVSEEIKNYEEQKDSTEITSQEARNDPDLKLMKSLLKRLNQPCKRSIKVLEVLETTIKTLDNTTTTLLEDGQSIQNEILDYCQSNDKNIKTVSIDTSSLLYKVDNLASLAVNISNNQQYITEQLKTQYDYLKIILNTDDKTTKDTNTPNIEEEIEDTFENNTYSRSEMPYFSTIYSDKLNCEELSSNDVSGIYVLGNNELNNSIGRKYNTRYCENSQNQFWTIIQRRGDNPNNQNFSLSWKEYKDGFGYLDKDFWFGNDFIHKITNDKDMILRIELEDFDGNTVWAEYSFIKVLSEEDDYKLLIGFYQGNATDSFSSHNNSRFSTYDKTNDDAPDCCPCSPSYGGGWWFFSCFEANLNGIYQNSPRGNEYFRGLIWEHWLGNYSLKKTKMMVRPRIVLDYDSGSGAEPEDPFNIPEDP